MKICLLADAQSIHTARIAGSLAARGHRVRVITYKPGAVPGVTVERFQVPLPGLRHPFRWAARRRRYLAEIVRHHDIVNIHFLQDWGFQQEAIREGCFVASPWGSDIVQAPGEDPPSAALLQHRRMLLRASAMVTAWGEHFAGEVSQFAQIDADSIARIPLGVDLRLFNPDRFVKSCNQFYHVGFFKGFRAVYGPTTLLEAIPKVVQELGDARFTLLGDGPLLQECHEMAQALGICKYLTWCPAQAHPLIPTYLAQWDLTVIPSVCESFGAAALEASAMCVPIVASDVGGLRETVRDGVTGVLVAPRDPNRLAAAIVELLKDRQKCSQMGRAGRDLVEKEYDWQKCVDKWEAVYERARELRCQMV